MQAKGRLEAAQEKLSDLLNECEVEVRDSHTLMLLLQQWQIHETGRGSKMRGKKI